MKKLTIRFIFIQLFFLLTINIFALTGRTVLKKMQHRTNYKNLNFTATMTITKGSRKLIKNFNGWGVKKGQNDNFFMRFTNPADRNVKYLKIKDALWIYLPAADDIIRISGHMLKKGMMGSDLSYEDLLHFDDFDKKYKATIIPAKPDKKQFHNVEIIAIVKNVRYYKMRILINKKTYLAHSFKAYSRSNRLLKIITNSDFKQFGRFSMPTKIEFKDLRKKNSLTVITYQKMQFNKRIPQGIFRKSYLYR